MSAFRIGLGFDAHPFASGRALRLGGVGLPHPLGLRGHSDGDALLHALTDALLGAAGRGSIGEQFPDTDPEWRGADSALFVEKAWALADAAGLAVSNVDAVVVAEAPKIAPHAAAMRARISELVRADASRVNVRGTSTNGLGFVGRNEGIAAMVVVLLESKASRES
jgi:2-C-methyl-D-erythritol 2,4-cyclodiphosphate synthase